MRFGLEPKSIDRLKAASARLAAARSMSFTAVSTYESPSRQGTPLATMTQSEVTLQRPNRLRVIPLGDGPALEFYEARDPPGTDQPANSPTLNRSQPTKQRTVASCLPPLLLTAPNTHIRVVFFAGALHRFRRAITTMGQ